MSNLDSIPYFEQYSEIKTLPTSKQSKTKYQTNQIQSSTLYTKQTRDTQDSSTSSAPLAKPESFSDLINDFDDCVPTDPNGSFCNTNLDDHINTSNMYYDDSMSYKLENNAPNEEELKSNLAWWPYTESYPTTQNNSLNNTKNKSIKSPNQIKKCIKNKINIIIENINNKEYLNDDLNSNRISTSTPRTDSTQEYSQTNDTTPLFTTNKKQRSSHFLTSCYQQNEYKRLDVNKFDYDDDPMINSNSFMQCSLNTPSFVNHRNYTSSHDEKMCLFSTSFSNSSGLSALLAHNKASKSLAPNNFKENKIDQSSLLSLSFGNNIKFSEDYSNIKFDSSNLNTNRFTESFHNESLTTNYKSIEKLEVLKPQSKDYILCFDTSSIDNSSSIESNDVMNSLLHSPINENSNFKLLDDSFSSNESSYYIYNSSLNENDDKKSNNNNKPKIIINDVTNDNNYKSVLDSCDSGVDTGTNTARTLSPFVFNTLCLNNNKITDQEASDEN